MTVTVNTLHKNTLFLRLVLGSPDKCLYSLQDQNGDVIQWSWPFTPRYSETGSGKLGSLSPGKKPHLVFIV